MEKENNNSKQEARPGGEGSKKALTPAQRQKRKQMIVYAVMGLVFIVAMYLIFAPSKPEEVSGNSVGGFNAEIPQPQSGALFEDKKTAYEGQQAEQLRTEKMHTLGDFSVLISGDGHSSDDLSLSDGGQSGNITADQASRSTGASTPVSGKSGVGSSVSAYRDINRTLGTFYESPKEDREKAELQAKVDELSARLEQGQSGRMSTREQLALLEKSYELAARYNASSQSGTPVQPAEAGKASASGKNTVTPVSHQRQNVVSFLAPVPSDSTFIAELSKPRNFGFNTAVSDESTEVRNTIRASVIRTVTVTSGQQLQLRLSEPVAAGGFIVPAGTVLTGTANIRGERLDITVSVIEYQGNIIPVELIVYDANGMQGLFIPDSDEMGAVKEIIANSGQGLNSSINISRQSAGEQLLTDLGRSAIQGTSQYVAKKIRKVKVTVKAGHNVLLLPGKNI